VSSNYTGEQRKVLEELEISIKRNEGCNGLPTAVQYINEGKGSFSGCVSNLSSLHYDKSHRAWFVNHDLQEFKLQALIASKLHYIHCVDVEREGWTAEIRYFEALFSDHEPLIRWRMDLQPDYEQGIKWINNPKDHSFRHWQMTLALRGDWHALKERAELFLSDVPPKLKQFAGDQQFYLALSQGDITAMQDILKEFITPKVVKSRNKAYWFGTPSSFISCYATMYAKIAWRHGYQIQLDTPLIPAEWLPVRPLDEYLDPYDFMRKYSL
jgi:hypothetical protein